jgi:hypothetical protein
MSFFRLERSHAAADAGVAPLVTGSPRSADQLPGSEHDELASLGLRSLADLLAPPSLVIAEDHLVLDGQYLRVLTLADLPPSVVSGWLNSVLVEQLPVTFSLHVRLLDAGAASHALKLKSWRLTGAIQDDLSHGRPTDNNLGTALEQVEALRRALARREAALFSVGLYLQLRADCRAALDALTQRLMSLFASQAGSALVPRLQQEQGFRACLPEGRDTLQVLHTLDTGVLSTLYPFVPAAPRMPGGVLLGVDQQTHGIVELDVFDHTVCQNANVGIFAPSGGGKTFFCQSPRAAIPAARRHDRRDCRRSKA